MRTFAIVVDADIDHDDTLTLSDHNVPLLSELTMVTAIDNLSAAANVDELDVVAAADLTAAPGDAEQEVALTDSDTLTFAFEDGVSNLTDNPTILLIGGTVYEDPIPTGRYLQT